MVTLPPLQAFGEWLQGRPWDQVIGQRLAVRCCPLAVWLRHALHLPGVAVDDVLIRVHTAELGWREWPTPDAYKRLIEAIDYGGMGQVEVTVQECKTALKQIVREQRPERQEVADTQMQEE